MTAITDVKAKVYKCVWKIKNFEHLCFSHRGLQSPAFTYGDNDENSFYLHFKQRGSVYRIGNSYAVKPGSISLLDTFSIYPQFPSQLQEASSCTISLLNSDDQEVITKRKLFSYVYLTAESPFENFVTEDFIFNRKNKLLPNGTLTIVCKICTEQGIETSYFDRIKNEIGNDLKKITPLNCSNQFENFEQLLEHNEYSDFKLVVNRKEFLVNKCILAARSRVFAAMLKHEMTESNDGKVEINDIEPEVMQEILRFIYAGKVNDVERIAPDLLVSADKYELEGLKSTCQEILIKKLSVENVDEMLILVDKMNVEKLKTAIIKFIIENSKVLNDSEKFKNVYKCLSSSFLADVTRALMMKLQ